MKKILGFDDIEIYVSKDGILVIEQDVFSSENYAFEKTSIAIPISLHDQLIKSIRESVKEYKNERREKTPKYQQKH